MTEEERDSRLAHNSCPMCHKTLDAATDVEDESLKPQPGDYSVCIYCGVFLVFGDDIRMEHFPDENLMEMEDEDRLKITKMRRAVMALERGDE